MNTRKRSRVWSFDTKCLRRTLRMNVIDTIRNSDIKEKCGYRSGLLKRARSHVETVSAKSLIRQACVDKRIPSEGEQSQKSR